MFFLPSLTLDWVHEGYFSECSDPARLLRFRGIRGKVTLLRSHILSAGARIPTRVCLTLRPRCFTLLFFLLLGSLCGRGRLFENLWWDPPPLSVSALPLYACLFLTLPCSTKETEPDIGVRCDPQVVPVPFSSCVTLVKLLNSGYQQL